MGDNSGPGQERQIVVRQASGGSHAIVRWSSKFIETDLQLLSAVRAALSKWSETEEGAAELAAFSVSGFPFIVSDLHGYLEESSRSELPEILEELGVWHMSVEAEDRPVLSTAWDYDTGLVP